MARLLRALAALAEDQKFSSKDINVYHMLSVEKARDVQPSGPGKEFPGVHKWRLLDQDGAWGVLMDGYEKHKTSHCTVGWGELDKTPSQLSHVLLCNALATGTHHPHPKARILKPISQDHNKERKHSECTFHCAFLQNHQGTITDEADREDKRSQTAG
ncbi:hypothetical protein STEG23_021678 [Scotinomys teguina]